MFRAVVSERSPGRALVALGGNAISGPDGSATPQEQQRAVESAMQQVAELIEHGWEVALTHGNGPQVGNLLRKNELARRVVPAVPLDWCVAQTQATIGMLMVTALERALKERGIGRPVACVVTRVLVSTEDEGWDHPTKPIGRFVTEAQARDGLTHGEHWEPFARGWRRVVPSPHPVEILDIATIQQLADDGVIVIAAGGGGVPMVRQDDGSLRGVEAVLDKDLSGALLAAALGSDCFVIATDVPAAATGYGTADQRWLGRIDPLALRRLADRGEFARGSMGPKIEAALRFVELGGRYAAIASLSELALAAAGRAGTIVSTAP
jgi:carbamate kinase